MGIFAAALRVKQLVSPATPSSGENALYPKANDKWYSKNSSGVETQIGEIAPGTITSTELANDAVDTANITNGSVTNAKIAPSTIDADRLSTSAVQMLRIDVKKDGANTQPDLATIDFTGAGVSVAGSAGTATVTISGVPPDGSVTSAKIADGTIIDADVATANKDGAVATPSLRTLGQASQQAAPGDHSHDAKQSVRLCSTTNITLNGSQTVDGVSTVPGDRVLLTGQTAPAENGIYVANSGAWARSTDADSYIELVSAFVIVQQGTNQADTGWVCTNNSPFILGTTAVTWVKKLGTGAITSNEIGYYAVYPNHMHASAGSTPDATTFLRGDDTWAVPGGAISNAGAHGEWNTNAAGSLAATTWTTRTGWAPIDATNSPPAGVTESSGVFTVANAGWYLITVLLTIDGGTPARRLARALLSNGLTTSGQWENSVNTGFETITDAGIGGSVVRWLPAGGTVTPQGYSGLAETWVAAPQCNVFTISAVGVGPQGDQGIPGVNGADWSSGALPPNQFAGMTGDYYLQTSTGQVYEKMNPTTWNVQADLTGPQGIQGIQGVKGDKGDQGDQGIQGIPGTGSTVPVLEEGVSAVGSATGLNFVGAGVLAAPGAGGLADVTIPGIPIGGVIMWPTATAPTDWLLCNGQSTTGYPLLAAVVGANVPDYRGVFPIGAGQQAGTGLVNKTLLALGGDNKITSAHLPLHTHSDGTLATVAVGNHTHAMFSGTTGGSANSAWRAAGTGGGDITTKADGSHPALDVTGATGDGGFANNEYLPPNRAINFIMRAA